MNKGVERNLIYNLGLARLGKAWPGEARQGCFKHKNKNKAQVKTKMKYKTTKRINKDMIKEILDIKKKSGLTAEAIVEQAKKKKSELHEFFEWDDTKAAEQWRIQQARILINEVKVLSNQEFNNAYAITNNVNIFSILIGLFLSVVIAGFISTKIMEILGNSSEQSEIIYIAINGQNIGIKIVATIHKIIARGSPVRI